MNNPINQHKLHVKESFKIEIINENQEYVIILNMKKYAIDFLWYHYNVIDYQFIILSSSTDKIISI